ncbi:hypothetical protein KR032_000589, partial [Drosophila birchii]
KSFPKKMCDFIFKIVIVGNVAVGKSALFGRFVQDTFSEDYKPTTLVNNEVCVTKVAGKTGVLQLWDGSGDGYFNVALRKVYPDAHSFIVVYDTTSLRSFGNVGYWLKDLADYGPKGVNIMLVGTKCDDQEGREVTKEMALCYAQQNGLSYMEASAKSGANVKEVFETLALETLDRLVPQSSTRSKEADNGDHLQGGQDKADKNQSDGDG